MCRAFLVFQFCFAALLLFCVQSANATSPPTITPGTGIYLPGPTVTLSAASGASIFYTLDNSLPSISSRSYSGPFAIGSTTTINAIAVQSGVPSSVATATITVDPTTLPIMVLPQDSQKILWLRSDLGITSSSGSVSSWSDLSRNWNDLSPVGNDATQSNSSNQPSLVLEAHNGYPAIATSTNKYFNLPSDFANLPTPAFYFVTRPTGSSNGVLLDLGNGSVSDNLTTSSNGAAATFTINQGSTPSSISSSSALTVDQYQELTTLKRAFGFDSLGHLFTNGVEKTSGTLNVPNNTTRAQNHIGTDYSASANFYNGSFLEILAFRNGIGVCSPDAYLLSRYQLLVPATPPAPIISVPSGTLTGPTQVAIATPPDCICKMTLDGSTPSSSSPDYLGPVNIYYSQTLKSIAIKNGIASSVASASYVLDSDQWPAPNPADTTTLRVNVQSPVE